MASTKIHYSQITGLGTAAPLDVGVGANQVVQLTAAAKLPAVDGSLLTNLSLGGFVLVSTQALGASPCQWTGLPDVRQFMLIANNISLTGGAGRPHLEIGAGSYGASGYTGGVLTLGGTTSAGAATAQALMNATNNDIAIYFGNLATTHVAELFALFTRTNTNDWQVQGQLWNKATTASANVSMFNARKSLGGSALDRIKLELSANNFNTGYATLLRSTQ